MGRSAQDFATPRPAPPDEQARYLRSSWSTALVTFEGEFDPHRTAPA
jgi:hypothetical protein